MSFLYPQLLWLLLVPAALLVIALRPRRTIADAYPKIPHARLRSTLGHWSLVIGHSPHAPRPFAAALALACLALALARPRGAALSAPTISEARDVLVAVDVSRSMLADDIAPDRLSRARLLVDNLADELRGERLGLMPFAGTAFLQSPLSADYEIFRTFLDELGPDMIPAGGSDFTALLTAADEAFGPADSGAPDAAPAADRFLFILSDGEAQDDTWKPVAQKLAARGVRILALGLGTADGAMIPDGKGGLVKDPAGAVVLSRLDSTTLRELARVTDGAYRDASSWVDLPALLRETIARARGARVATDETPRREELFAWFLAPALALLALALLREFPVTPRQRPPRVSVPPLPTRYASSLALLFALATSLPAADEPAAPPDPLVELVGRLATAADLAPADLARLAALTAEQGEKARAAQGAAPFPEGAIHDALAATSEGRAAAPAAADWAGLRSRLEALLAPPPEQPKPEQNQNQKNEDSDPSDSKSDPQESKSGESQNSESKPDSKSAPSDSEDPQSSDQKSSGTPESASDQKSGSGPGSESEQPEPPKPSEQSLGDLAEKPDAPESPAPSPAEESEEPPVDEPTQRAGGVSASGRPDGAEPSADAALTLPQQRLERVRGADAPARLYQLLQNAEAPPDAERRASGTPTRDW